MRKPDLILKAKIDNISMILTHDEVLVPDLQESLSALASFIMGCPMEVTLQTKKECKCQE